MRKTETSIQETVYNNNQDVRRVLTQLVNGFYSPENPGILRLTSMTLLEKTPAFLLDFDSYKAHNRIVLLTAMKNTGQEQQCSRQHPQVSSHLTVRSKEYKEMWHLEKVNSILLNRR